MKKKLFRSYTGMAAVCTMLVFVSCGNDIELTNDAPVKGEYKVTFTASQESSATRTALNGTDVVWQAGDAITVFDGAGANCTFELATGAGRTVGQFEGTITVTEPKKYCAVYPAMANATIDAVHGISGLSLPVEQTATPGSFDPQAAIMTARNDNADGIVDKEKDLTLGEFKHVCTFVKVTTTEPYDKITFTSNDGERIAGGFIAYVDENGISTVTPDNATSPSVSLVPADGETEIAAGTYLIAILPRTLEHGFTMSCSKNDVTNNQFTAMTRSYNNAVEETVFARHNVVNMGTVSEANGWTLFTPTYVDLGLSVKWATCNVGATTPYGYGDYFAWGETTPKDIYNWTTYRYTTDGGSTLTKYNATDLKTVFDVADDAATANWGDAWRMPTSEEQQELMNKCYWEWTNNYNNTNVKGFIVYKAKDPDDKGVIKSSNSNTTTAENYDAATDNHIFLPAAGDHYGNHLDGDGSYGRYWSSSLNEENRKNAERIYYGPTVVGTSKTLRYYGFSVRPVLVKD